jgi:hypothetical protein
MAFLMAPLARPGAPTLAAALLTLATITVAGPSDYMPTPISEERAAVQSFLNQRLWLWQKRLHLHDWKITVKLVRASELRPKTLGNVNWDRKIKTATISVMDPSDYKLSGQPMRDDMEMTVVHELVHLHLSGLPRNESTKAAEEQAVNMLTEALIRLDRRRDEPMEVEHQVSQSARQEAPAGQ